MMIFKKKLSSETLLLIASFSFLIIILWSYFWANNEVKSLQSEAKEFREEVKNFSGESARKDKLELKKEAIAVKKDLLEIKINIDGTVIQSLSLALTIFAGYTAWQDLKDKKDREAKTMFDAASEKLKNSDINIRIDGIYDLKNIMNSSENQYKQVVKRLVDHVREKCDLTKLTEDEKKKEVSSDVQAAFTVLGMCKNREYLDKGLLDFKGLNLTKVLFEELDFSQANFCKANLQGANFCKANLQGANFREANLQGANFREANLEKANLDEADLTKVNFKEAMLTGAELTKAKVMGAFFNTELKDVILTCAKYNLGTVFPNGFNPKDKFMKEVELTNQSLTTNPIFF